MSFACWILSILISDGCPSESTRIRTLFYCESFSQKFFIQIHCFMTFLLIRAYVIRTLSIWSSTSKLIYTFLGNYCLCLFKLFRSCLKMIRVVSSNWNYLMSLLISAEPEFLHRSHACFCIYFYLLISNKVEVDLFTPEAYQVKLTWLFDYIFIC